MSFSSSETLYAYNFISIWEVTLVVASDVALSDLLTPLSLNFLILEWG